MSHVDPNAPQRCEKCGGHMVLWLTAAAVAIGACANPKSDAKDSAAAQPVVSNSPASSGWSDAELLAYTRAVAMTLIADAPTIEKRVRSTALRSFARRVVFQQKQIIYRADSLTQREADVPAAGAVTLRRHVDGMKRLASQRDFDLQYVKLVRQTLRDAQARLEGSNYATRGDGMKQLLDYAVSAMRAEGSNARKIEAALLERRAPPPATKKR